MPDRCTICPRALPETEADRYACQACVYRIRAWLRQLPAELPLLQAQLQPSGQPGQGHAGGRAHSPAPLRLDVLDMLGPGGPVLDDPHGDQTGGLPITATLYGWARLIASEHPAVWHDRHGTVQIAPCEGAASRYGGSPAAWCSWLLRYLAYAVGRLWIGELYRELEDLMGRVQAITGTAVRTRRMMAPCPACQMFALTTVDGDWFIKCQACPEILDRDAYAAHCTAVLPPLTRLAVLLADAEVTGDAEAA